MVTIAYLYKWTELSTNKWYCGSRTRKGCHPEDGYLCSSKTVKPMILENRPNWKREVLIIGEPKYIRQLETKYLKILNAKNDTMSYNQHNQDGKFHTIGKDPWNKNTKGICKPNKGTFTRGHTPTNKGIKNLDQAKKMIGNTYGEMNKGKIFKKQPKITCPHCNKVGGASQMKRWHFSNCAVYRQAPPGVA